MTDQIASAQSHIPQADVPQADVPQAADVTNAQIHYDRFWSGLRNFVEDRLAAGERDLLALVNQIQEHRNTQVTGAGVPPENGDAYAASLAAQEHRALIFGEHTRVPCGLFDREFTFYKVLTSCITPETEAVVEFGSGYGRNLFWIDALTRHVHPNLRYIACELTDAGRDTTRRLASLRPEMDIEVVPFDYRAPDLRFLEQYGKAVAFSLASIEQIAEMPRRFVQGLLDLGIDLTVLHYEPVGWQESPTLRMLVDRALDGHGAGLPQDQYLDILESLNQRLPEAQRAEKSDLPKLALTMNRDLNRNLLPLLSEFWSEEAIEVLFFRPDMWGGVRCPMTLLGWRRRA